MNEINAGDVIVALNDTDEGFKAGQVCLVERVDISDDYGDCYDVMVLKAWTDTHAYFGRPGEGHFHEATRIEEPSNFQIIGRADGLGELGIVSLNGKILEALG